MDTNRKYDLCAKAVTLDGKPAKITGALNRFATVRDAKGKEAEFAWETVDRIVRKDGEFKW